MVCVRSTTTDTILCVAGQTYPCNVGLRSSITVYVHSFIDYVTQLFRMCPGLKFVDIRSSANSPAAALPWAGKRQRFRYAMCDLLSLARSARWAS